MLKTQKGKRVVPFTDSYDEVPNGAKWLFSEKQTLELPPTEEQYNKKIISGNEIDLNKVTYQIHYYEITQDQFDKLMNNGFGELSILDKVLLFKERYNIGIT